jgi:crotonobetainyl-CoA:carnitine CoA-transferase CaiB-like acyl-CoA transferase
VDEALAGLRVLDLSTLFAAPQVSAMLGDFGADVVKVEPPGGDPLRTLGSRRQGRSLVYALACRGKRVVTLDAGTDAGRADLHRLVDLADVVVVNQPPAVLARWGCTYEEVAARNRRAVYVWVTCYGATGPYAELPGNGSLAEAFAGLTHLTGMPDGPPMLPSVALGDSLVALAGVVGALVACYTRDVKGAAGQCVDVSMFEPVLGLLGSAVAGWDPGDPPPGRTGSRVAGGVPRNVYRTADDRWVVLSGTTDPQVARVLRVMGMDTPAAAARYGHSADRLRVADELDGLVADWIGARDRDTVLAAFRSARVPIAPVNDLADLAGDRHVRERGSLCAVADDGLGTVLVPAPAPRLSATPGRVRALGGGAGSAVTVPEVLSGWSSGRHPRGAAS